MIMLAFKMPSYQNRFHKEIDEKNPFLHKFDILERVLLNRFLTPYNGCVWMNVDLPKSTGICLHNDDAVDLNPG